MQGGVRSTPLWVTVGNQLADAPLPRLHFSQRISFPFAGIGGAERALLESEGSWPFEPVNTIEKDKYCVKVLNRLRELAGQGEKEVVVQRDFFQVAESDVEICEGVIGTSPCTAFSKSGRQKGFSVVDGQLFIGQLEFIKVLAKRGAGNHGR